MNFKNKSSLSLSLSPLELETKIEKANLPSADTVAKKAEVAAELARLAVSMEEMFEGKADKASLQVSRPPVELN